MSEGYLKQVELLVRCLPEIAKEQNFALKGGTAINLFYRQMPRLSVDIDLAYLPLKSREDSLAGISSGLQSFAGSLQERLPGTVVHSSETGGIITKLVEQRDGVIIKIEPNLVFRGSVYPAVVRSLVDTAQRKLEVDVSVTCLSEADLYGGKLCAVSSETGDEPVEGESGTVQSQNEPVEPENEPVEVGNGTAGGENEPVEAENEPVELDVSPFRLRLLNLIKENPEITYDQMAEATDKGRSTIRRHIKVLREKNLVRRVGSDRHGYWETNE